MCYQQKIKCYFFAICIILFMYVRTTYVCTHRWWNSRDAVWPYQNQIRQPSSPRNIASSATRQNCVIWHVTPYVGNVGPTRRWCRHRLATSLRYALVSPLLFLCSGNNTALAHFQYSANFSTHPFMHSDNIQYRDLLRYLWLITSN